MPRHFDLREEAPGPLVYFYFRLELGLLVLGCGLWPLGQPAVGVSAVVSGLWVSPRGYSVSLERFLRSCR